VKGHGFTLAQEKIRDPIGGSPLCSPLISEKTNDLSEGMLEKKSQGKNVRFFDYLLMKVCRDTLN
jgi:hypothetical protein